MNERLGRYETLARLGTGGMASVFVGRVQGYGGFSQLVALKRAHEHVRNDPSLVDGLKREAMLASRIQHPNVVGVIEVQESDGDVVLVLDYVEGSTLSDLSRRIDSARYPREMLRILLDTAAGLDAAHRTTDESGQPLHLVHRDVSPSNMLIGRDGITRISDFGVAKTMERAREETAAGVLKGKLAYMAPEYVETHRIDARSDQYSLAVVAWELLTGARLFKSNTEIETLQRLAAQNIPHPSQYFPHLAVLDSTLLRALSRDPAQRFESVGAFADELLKQAREANLIGSNIEVAALIEGVFGPELTERRRRFGVEAAIPPGQSASSPGFVPYPAPVHSGFDVPSFTQSAPAQSMTQSALVTSRSRLAALIPLSLLAIAVAVGTGVWLAHHMRTQASARAAERMAAPPSTETSAPPPSASQPDPATSHRFEYVDNAPSNPPEASSHPTPSSTAAARLRVQSAASASESKPTAKPAPAPRPRPTAAPAPAPSPATPRIIPDKVPPNPYGP